MPSDYKTNWPGAMADFKPRNILIIGATGNIGRFITQSIVSARSEFDRIAILTSAPAAGSDKEKFIEELKSKNVEIIIGDINNETNVVNAYKGIDTVIFALGRGALLPQIQLIKLAASPGSSVKWIFPSEYGTDIKYGPSSASEPTHQAKLKIRAYIEEDDGIKKSGLKYTYVVTGPYPEMYFKGPAGYPQAGSWDVKSKTAYLLEKDNKISFTTMKDTGDLVLAALRHPSASFNKALKVNSYTVTPAEIQAEFERQTGGGWTVHETSIDGVKEFEKTAWETGRPDAAIYTLRRIWAEGGTLYEKRDNDVIGNPELLTLKDTVAWYIKTST
ncbi:isoflavone reductase family protein [Talaromyces stipitatus ATCC 10500]|uniref:Isoflavone reductase family protein n=1 Tax=Talaromyces stipitatus (strain ATCC 10500 / CBS 375.48 / QM 6759 / NRRL 1006) TaxID=441959 RepID=B8LU22_TALSN|nr:isoflavone reductase family protein [Talaromyces stipitatus ATCC 10500]EED23852.1 isoflavone reductase family protein [Talaromyces stipitatus ATCC 10500]